MTKPVQNISLSIDNDKIDSIEQKLQKLKKILNSTKEKRKTMNRQELLTVSK